MGMTGTGRYALGTACVVLALGGSMSVAGNRFQPAPPAFDRAERKAVADFWAAEGRYTVGLPADVATQGEWQVRQSPEGSVWLHAYTRAIRGAAKVPPTQIATGTTPQQTGWDAWIEAKYAWEEASLRQDADRRNNRPLTPLGEAKDPGPAPEDLVRTVGQAPPAFLEVVRPQRHTVKFDDFTADLVDHTKVRRRFAFYRFREGVMHVGEAMRGRTVDDLKPLFNAAGVSDAELRVMAAVSLLEGGFDSLNTYDTGFVSVGFIQFASLRDGAGSLGQVMRRMKQDAPQDFQAHFRRFGLDVTADGRLIALDPATGVEFVGAEANTRIILDRRLAAVFHRAGRLSQEFRLAQIRVCKDMYYPADDEVEFTVGTTTYRGKIREFIRTEAGMATLMDRKVNTGNYGDLIPLLQSYATTYGFRTLAEFAQAEFQLVRALQYRKDYMAMDGLSRPRDLGIAASRGGRAGDRNRPGTNSSGGGSGTTGRRGS